MLMAENVLSLSPMTLPAWGHSSTSSKGKVYFMVSATFQKLRISNPMK